MFSIKNIQNLLIIPFSFTKDKTLTNSSLPTYEFKILIFFLSLLNFNKINLLDFLNNFNLQIYFK